MAESLVNLRQVMVRYGVTTALDIDNLDVKVGELLAIIGPNGAGKSTLLRVIGLLQKIDRGIVAFPSLGQKFPNRLALRRRVATVFQQPVLVDANVFANVALGLRLRGCNKAEIERRVMPWLERFSIERLASQPARTLSGGEAQRVSLARALVLEPDLLLLDEPFSALDPTSREALLRDFHRSVKTLAVTAVLVTHDRQEASALGQRVAVLDHGRLVQIGSRDEVFRRPVSDLVAALVGFENRITGVVEASNNLESQVTIGAQKVVITGTYPVGSPVTLCFHARSVRVLLPGTAAVGSVRLSGTIRDIYHRQSPAEIAVDCGGFEIVGAADLHGDSLTRLSEGTAVIVSLDPVTLHVIATGSSR